MIATRLLKILRVITWVIIVLYLLICVVGFLFLRHPQLSYYVILSGSMQPEINIDDVVVSRNMDADEVTSSLEIGDVATYYDGKTYVTHRVYDKTVLPNGNAVFIFKGDNNNTIDRYSVKADQIKGKHIYNLQGMGWLFEFLNSTYGLITLICILLLLFTVENTFAYVLNAKQSKRQSETGGEQPVDNLQPTS